MTKGPAASKQRKTGIDPGGVLVSMDAGVGVTCSLHRKLAILVTPYPITKSWGEHWTWGHETWGHVTWVM